MHWAIDEKHTCRDWAGTYMYTCSSELPESCTPQKDFLTVKEHGFVLKRFPVVLVRHSAE